MEDHSRDLAAVARIPVVATLLDVICRTTGMGFAAIARVTEERWIACSVLDRIGFGLEAGSELPVETTLCHEVRQARQAVVIDHVEESEQYRAHHTPQRYRFQSYISMPIFLPGGQFFGTLCSIDPRPNRLNRPEIVGMFELFAQLIAFHIDAAEKLTRSETTLLAEREVSELREQFIGVLGHDLRSPLGAISMGATMLKLSALDDDQVETVDMMKRSVTRMSDLIDDTLDFARGRLGGGIEVELKAEAPAGEMLRQVIQEVRTSWPHRVIESRIELLEEFAFDRKRLAQLFTNLLTNAMTHGLADRPVKIRAVSGAGRFELSVANAAEPIPPEVQSRLFEPFSRGEPGDYKQGLGLGLYIASEIAKSHGGMLRVSSTREETRFTFAMPVRAPAPAAAPAPTPLSPPPAPGPLPSHAHILLIEDHADTLRILTRLLSRKGHAVTGVASGAEARAAFARDRFELIVSDLGLPDCSGLELVAELRAIAPVPAIALSGYGREDDIQSCREAGFAEHLTKPVDFEQFLQTVNRLLAAPAGG